MPSSVLPPPKPRPPHPHPTTQVTEGSGKILVTAVGEHSEWGRTMMMVMGESGDTPLQEKLGVLALGIGKLGFVIAVICFFVLLIRWIIQEGGFPMDEFSSGPLEFFIFSVTILVGAWVGEIEGRLGWGGWGGCKGACHHPWRGEGLRPMLAA